MSGTLPLLILRLCRRWVIGLLFIGHVEQGLLVYHPFSDQKNQDECSDNRETDQLPLQDVNQSVVDDWHFRRGRNSFDIGEERWRPRERGEKESSFPFDRLST